MLCPTLQRLLYMMIWVIILEGSEDKHEVPVCCSGPEAQAAEIGPFRGDPFILHKEETSEKE